MISQRGSMKSRHDLINLGYWGYDSFRISM